MGERKEEGYVRYQHDRLVQGVRIRDLGRSNKSISSPNQLRRSLLWSNHVAVMRDTTRRAEREVKKLEADLEEQRERLEHLRRFQRAMEGDKEAQRARDADIKEFVDSGEYDQLKEQLKELLREWEIAGTD